MTTFVEGTKLLIRDLGIKQKVVAERAGYSVQQFSNMLNGRKLISATDVWRISQALGVTPNDLFGITSQKG